MAEKLNGYINIPYPLLMLLGTVFVACITWGITVAGTKRQDVTTAATYYRQVDVNTNVINNEIKPYIQIRIPMKMRRYARSAGRQSRKCP